MPLSASKLSDLINVLYDIREAKAQGLLDNPQCDAMEAAVKVAIDEEMAE